MINKYGISNLLIMIGSLAIAFFVYKKGHNSSLNKTWTPFALSVATYGFGAYMVTNAKNPSEAIFWWQIAYIGIISIPFLFLRFTYEFLNIKRPLVIKLFAIPTILFLAANFLSRKLFIADVFLYFTDLKFVKPIYFVYPIGPLLYIFIIFCFFGIIAYAHFELIKRYRKAVKLERRQITYFFVATACGFVGGGLSFLPCFKISFYPFFNFAVFLSPVIMAYAILRHRLMDIDVIIRETAVFAGIFGFSVGIFMLAIVAGEQFIQPYIGQSQWLVPALSLLLVTFAIRPIERLAYNIIGKHLFRKKFEYKKILRDASVGMSTVRDPKKLLGLIVHIISMKIRLINVSILIYDEKQSIYKIKASRNMSRIEEKNMTLSTENPLIQWLVEKKTPLSLEEAQKWNKHDSSHSSKSVLTSDLVQIEHRMKDLDAAVCVPSFYRDELLGILVLGDKKSGDFFSQDDLDLFSALADESAVALKNSQLYFEIDMKANELEELYKREHRLFMHASVAFAAAIDARDPYTHGHSERVTNFSLAILDCMGAVHQVDNNPLFRQRLQIAAVLHDIGKIGVPDDILHKPSKLSDKEWEAMRKHPVTGAEIVTHIKGLRDLIGGIRHHHERYDGKGYPDGLKSDEIPFMAKIIAVADTFDAMTSDRPYRKGLSVEVAREEIQRNAAAQFDPYMVAAFLKAYEQGAIKQSAISKKVELIID